MTLSWMQFSFPLLKRSIRIEDLLKENSHWSQVFLNTNREVWIAEGQNRWSRWPRDLRHELFSLARTLGSWVRNLLKSWMSVCAFILCLCFSVCRRRPCDGLISRPRSPTVCVKMIMELKKRLGSKNDYRATDEWKWMKEGQDLWTWLIE
jgi:hypothetical protein